jgi:hypothetical protein
MPIATKVATQTLVWIDAREAVIVRRQDGEIVVERLESDVPAHRRSTGHVRHDPGLRHGGGGSSPQSAGEPRRLEHLARFLRIVADRLPVNDDITILGPGTVPEHLEHDLCADDRHHLRRRVVRSERSGRMTDRQLAARLDREVGIERRRRTVGAYRWSGRSRTAPSGRREQGPTRVTEKPPRDAVEEGIEA